jgi:hypothetical protein
MEIGPCIVTAKATNAKRPAHLQVDRFIVKEDRGRLRVDEG